MNLELNLGPEYQHVASFCILMSGAVFIVHMIGNLFICFNRFSAMYLAEKYDKIWRRRNVWIVIVSQYVIAIVALYHTIGAQMLYNRDSNGSYTFVGLEKHLDVINRFIYFGVCLLYALSSVVMNGFLLYGLQRFGVGRQNEKGLFIYTSIGFVFSLLMCVQQISKVYAITANKEELLRFISMQFFWINDFMVSIPPLSLLAFCSGLRHAAIDMIRCRRCKNRTVVQTLSTAQRRTKTWGV